MHYLRWWHLFFKLAVNELIGSYQGPGRSKSNGLSVSMLYCHAHVLHITLHLMQAVRNIVCCRFTSDQNAKEMFAGASGIVITTYSMIAYSGKRSEESMKVSSGVQSARALCTFSADTAAYIAIAQDSIT